MESQVALSGYVGSDVEFITKDDWVLARFRMGCTPSWRRGEEWVNGETNWMSIRASGNMALNVRDSVRKGDPLVVIGRLRTRVWTDAQGNRRQQLLVDAMSLGHDIAKGVSTFVRPQRVVAPLEEEPLEPDHDEVGDEPDDEEEALLAA